MRATKTPKITMCPCCGLELKSEADRMICPACAGNPTETDIEVTNRHRRAWVISGMPWTISKEPKGWDKVHNLGRLALIATRGRVRGRPPRLL